ncbi:MAG TPA: hypothetical protein VJ696_03145 [Rhodanobacteraceae bacterium]|nr:hypothetical protein [Rhodanobacteraceae bacterium]
MSAADALAFVERHGIVLESARHAAIPSLAEAIAGAPIRGSWWTHPQGKTIFRLTRSVRADDDVLVCRLVGDRITFAHRRIWPALVRLAGLIAPSRLARVSETHGESGAHRTGEIRFPRWVPAETKRDAKALGEREARAMLAPLLDEETGR